MSCGISRKSLSGIMTEVHCYMLINFDKCLKILTSIFRGSLSKWLLAKQFR